MKFLKVFFLVGIVFSMQSQMKVADINGSFGKIKQAFNVADEATGNFAVFLEDSERVYGVLYNKDFTEIGRVSAPDLSSKFKSILGYQIHGKNITLLMNTLNGRSYGVVQFDFDTGRGSSQELEFKVRGEKMIEAVRFQNKVYLLTVPNFSSQINVYTFSDMLSPSLTEVKFGKEDLMDRRERPIRLYDLLDKAELGHVELDVPNSLEVTSKDFKTYQDGNRVLLTSDKYNEFTYVITLDLNKLSQNVQRIAKPEFQGFKMGIKSNSFWHYGKLFQVSANRDYFKLQLVDLASEEVVKKYELTDEDELFFKNTPIILEGGDFQAYRELERTKQFLRKIAEGHIGLSVYKENDIYQITMGSTVEQESGYIVLGGAVGGLAGALVVVSINQLTSSYALYGNTKSARIVGLFDDDLNHVTGDIPKNSFDEMKALSNNDPLDQTEKIAIQAETLFKIDDNFIRGFYNKKNEVYSLYLY